MHEPSPQEQLGRFLTGSWLSQAVYVAAKLGLADILKDGPQSAEALADLTKTHPQSLHRLLRALASFGMFAEDEKHRFANTPLSEPLRGDAPGSQRALAIMIGEEQYRAWGELLYSIQTGKTAFEHVYGMPIFDYLAKHPDKGAVFDAAMTGVHGRETAAMLDAYDLAGMKTFADIGGGNGSVITAVLQRHPQMHGILFDLPGVIGRASANLLKAGVADRCRTVAGSFFESVPAGADAYLLRHIIHDWDDAKSTTILKAVRKAIGAGGRLLVVEGVIPPGNAPSFTKLLDLTMLVAPGGLERTEDEYRKLFAGAGFRLTRIVPTATDVSVIEGRPE